MEKPKEFRLVAYIKPDGNIHTNKEIDKRINPLELIGLYDFIKEQYRGTFLTSGLAIHGAISDKAMIVRGVPFKLPQEVRRFDVFTYLELLRKKEIQNLKKILEIRKNKDEIQDK
ncbi:hypothetical protein CCP1ISM_60005 [Azospirillaceae bacterium]